MTMKTQKFNPVECNFDKNDIPRLKAAMLVTEKQTYCHNTSILFTEFGFIINEPIDEKFLFSFGMNYGKLLAAEKLTK